MKNRFKLSDHEMSLSLIDKAERWAYAAHVGQTRKYTGEPYFEHCYRVAALVHQRGGSPQMVAAAFLHDTVEDTEATIFDVGDDFGKVIAQLVLELTDVYTPENYSHMNRAERKAAEAARLACVSFAAQCIKLCDLIDNTSDIMANDPLFGLTYLKEKARILGGFRSEVLRWGHRDNWGQP